MIEPSKVKIFCPDSDQRNSIPDLKPATGYASYNEGFPPESQEPLASGGVAPQRRDFNGLFWLMTTALRWIEEGGLWSYDAGIDYVPGAIITEAGTIYRCKTANGPSYTVKAPSADSARAYWVPVLGASGVLAPVVAAYPVGSIYMTTAEGDPSTLLGFGTWQRISGRFLLAADSSHAVGSVGGSGSVVLTTAQLPAHSHATTIAVNGSHAHTVTIASNGAHSHTATVSNAGNHAHSGTTASAGAHTHTRGTMNITGKFYGYDAGYTNDFKGDGAAFTSSGNAGRQSSSDGTARDANYIMNFDASRAWSGSTSSAAAHTHTITTEIAGSHNHSASVASNGSHAHTATDAAAGDHTHTANVANTGGGQSVSIMPPYFAVNVWRRVE